MATDLAHDKSTPPSKYDAFVAAQLAKAESRIRLLDLIAGLLGLAALCLLYIVGMVLCDSKLMLSQQTRQLTLYAFLAGGGVYLFFAVLRPLRLRVNPYYAARQVELLLPHAKNSIVNWVDLHEQPLSPAIRGALGQRAAKDLSQVDLESAISGRRAAWMGGWAGLFAVAFLVAFFLLGPAPFVSLLKRTFNPFGAVGVSTRTQLTILKPEGGNATVTVGRGINFAVEVGGKTPNAKAEDAVKLLYRYEEGDPWLERRLVPEDNREWTTSLSSLEIRNGFWYKITGGDAVTEEYRVGVRAAPAILHFLATYHFRPYVARADEVRHERALKELRGTEILLRVHTNRMLREGWLEFEKEGAKPVRGEVDTNDPQTLLVRFVLNEDGKYRLRFTSTENEAYNDPVAYPVTALPDNPPTVELTKPGKDIPLPTDALLQLEGHAVDDIGVASLVLRMRVNGDKLRGQPYRSDERMRLTDGGYPLALEYRDFVELSRVQSEDGQAYPLRAGMELEYWLEARDACDYPQANVAESKHYRVLLTEAEKNEPKQQQDKKRAEKEKKQAEQKQDRQLQKENRERQQQRQEQQARNQEEENKSKDDDKGKAGDQSQAKEGAQPNNPEGKDNNGQGENNNGQGENEGLSKEDRATEEQIEKALEKKEDAKGEGKPENSDPGESKGDRNKPNSGDASGSKSEGENKGADARAGKDSGEGKEKGQSQAGNDASKGDGKGEHPSDSLDGDKSEPKGGAPKNQPGTGESGEAKGKPDTAPQPSEDKNGDPQADKKAGQGEPQPKGQGQDSSGDNKAADGKGQQGEREAMGASKDKGNGQAEAKREKDGRKDEGKAEGKQGGTSSTGEPVGEGDAKPSSGNGANDATGQGQGKPDAAAQARDAASKEIQDLERKLESKDAGEREEAKRQLERIEKEAANPDAREKAGEALDKGTPKNGNKGNSSSGSEDGDNSSKAPKKGDGVAANNSQGDGSSPGGGGSRRSDKGKSGDRGRAAESRDHPAKPHDPRAAQMQLEDFAKKVNKDILKDAGVSEEAWKKYLESKRKQVAPREKPRPETPPHPQQATPLPNMGGRTIQPSSSGQDDLHGPDRGQPPPGYRDSFREFTRQMTKGK